MFERKLGPHYRHFDSFGTRLSEFASAGSYWLSCLHSGQAVAVDYLRRCTAGGLTPHLEAELFANSTQLTKQFKLHLTPTVLY